jgi:hypothetical protein
MPYFSQDLLDPMTVQLSRINATSTSQFSASPTNVRGASAPLVVWKSFTFNYLGTGMTSFVMEKQIRLMLPNSLPGYREFSEASKHMKALQADLAALKTILAVATSATNFSWAFGSTESFSISNAAVTRITKLIARYTLTADTDA